MSKLDELIKELCPNGVEYKTLGELGEFYGGLTGKSKNDFVDGNAKFITYMNVYKNLKLNLDVSEKVKIAPNENQRTLEYGDVLFTGSSETPDECGISSVLADRTDEQLYLNSFCICYRFNNKELFNPDFSKYLFRSDNLRKQIVKTASGVTRFNVSKEKMRKVVVPIVPLPVQEEIVRILDTFTSLTAELTAELTARRKQYEYYRDSLLTRETKVELKTLNQISENCDNQRKPVTSGNRVKGEYPYYGASGIVDYVDDYIFDGDYLLVSEDGANLLARSSPIAFSISGKNWVNNHAHILKFKESATRKFVEYYLNSINLEKYISGGAQPKLNQQNLNKIPIPLPPLDVQERIVNVLDNFDSICTDLKIGLPAEIEARKKQYEYYRDLLLTFASSGNTILSEQNRTEQNRTEQNRTDEIKLLQYVFGYAIVRLGEIAKINRGVRVTRDMLDENGSIPVYQNSLAPLGYFEKSNRKGNTTFVISAGAAGQIGYSDIDFWSADDCFTFDEVNSAINKYIYYFLQTKQAFIDSRVRRGSIPRISREVFEKLEIQLPTLEEQKRIVKILDRFDSLCNDISSGLPAEIEARRKQYEYYRDKLLTFDRIEA